MPRDEHFEYKLPPILENLDLDEILKQIPKIDLKACFWDELNIGDKTSLHIKVKSTFLLKKGDIWEKNALYDMLF